MGRFQPFPIPEFQGLNEDENPHALNPAQLRVALNCWRLGRSYGTRPGTKREPDSLYAVDIAGTPTVCGLADFRRYQDTVRDLVAIVPGAIHYEDASTLDIATNSVTVTNASELPWTFAQHKNMLFAAGGTAGDHAWYWDGLTTGGAGVQYTAKKLGILNGAGAATEPRYIFEWNNRLFAGGFTGTDPAANPGLVRFSALNDGTTWPAENSFGGNFSVGGFSADSKEYVTGFGSYQDNQGTWVLALTNQRIYSMAETASIYSPFQRFDSIAVGCVHQNAFVSLGQDASDAIWISPYGVHSLRQSQQFGARQDKFLSWPIRQTFASINRTRMNRIVGAYWPKYGYVLWAVSTGASLVNDTILALDIKNQTEETLNADTARWSIFKLEGHDLSALVAGFDQTGRNPQLFFGNYDGQVGVFSTDTYADMETGAYEVRYATKYSHFGQPTRTKVLGDVYADVGPGGAYTPTMQTFLDFGAEPQEQLKIKLPSTGAAWDAITSLWDVSVFGDANQILRNKLNPTGLGDVFSFEFRHAGLNEPFYTHGLFIEAAIMGEGSDS